MKFFSILIGILFFSCHSNLPKADLVIHGGTILSMIDGQKKIEAIAVSNGIITAAGSLDEINNRIGTNTIVKHLEGKTLLPGFIDGHSHITMAMKTIRWADLNAPPVGGVHDMEDVISSLRQYQKAFAPEPGDWILGWGYDPDQLDEIRHPNRTELSKAFPDHPVFLLHVSGHMAVVNDAALHLANITRETPDPSNGIIVREDRSRKPNGLLQEKAMYLMLPLLPIPDEEQLVRLFTETQELYASHGITTAQDGLTDYASWQFLKKISQNQQLDLDIEALASFMEAEEFSDEDYGIAKNGLRLSGMKIVSDGSPQGKTAFFREPYLTEVPGCLHQCTGFPTISRNQLSHLLASNYQKGIQTFVHANGDGAIELLLNTHKRICDSLHLKVDDQRTVVIHSQFVGRDQLNRYKDYKFVPSFFTNHAFFWGDVHLNNLGEERASFLSPMKSAADLNIIATNHTDYTITPIDQLFLLWTAVNRKTRSGRTLGVEECITPWQGLQAITTNSAYQHKIEKEKGSIAVGKLADLVILDKNPLTVPEEDILNIVVLETIKEGRTIYKKSL